MNRKAILKDAGLVIIGSILYGAALAIFLTPRNIVMGGASGISVTIHALTKMPVGIGILLLNIPLLLLNVRVCGGRGMARTIIGVFATSIFTDLLEFLPPASEDALLSAFCGGAMMGAGAGIMLPRGFTTGGSDLAAYLINRKINPELDTMFLTSEHQFTYLSSSMVKELGSYDVDLTDFLPAAIVPDFRKRIEEIRQGGNT